MLEKTLTGPDKANIISELRSKVSGLRNRGKSFPSKAAPVEKECQALVSEYKKLDALKKVGDKKLAAIQAEMDTNYAEFKQDILPRRKDLADERARIHGMGCAFVGATVEKKLYERCIGPENVFLSHEQAVNKDADVYQNKYNQLVAQKEVASKPYTQALNNYTAHYQSFKQGLDHYNIGRNSWSSDMQQVWGRTSQLAMQAYKARKQVVRKTPVKHNGGEIGKLSGPFDKGNSGRSPGSGKLPAGTTAGGEGGAKGQARAAAKTSGHGMTSGNASGAAFQAGRVFDRGDVKVSGKPSVFKAHGIHAKPVPEEVRQNPRWQALERQGKEYRVEQEKAQRKIDTIKQKLQAGEGDKGQLQVELVHARDVKNAIDSKVNVNKVEMESFMIPIEKKAAKQPRK